MSIKNLICREAFIRFHWINVTSGGFF
uniref:Uncharacterized protein n=1 Tax=Arundo donax TaxID=35708 RepID=A0A0A9E2Z1_ARUDO